MRQRDVRNIQQQLLREAFVQQATLVWRSVVYDSFGQQTTAYTNLATIPCQIITRTADKDDKTVRTDPAGIKKVIRRVLRTLPNYVDPNADAVFVENRYWSIVDQYIDPYQIYAELTLEIEVLEYGD